MRSPCKSGWTDHFSGPVGNYQSPALRTRFSEGGSPSMPAIFPPRGANRSGSRLLSGPMVVQLHPWRLSEGEPARRGHPFEAGRATATSLGIEPSTFRHWRENRARPGTCWKHVGSAERRLWSMTTSLRHFRRANPKSSGVASKANGPAPPVVMRVHRRCSPRRPLRGHSCDSPLTFVWGCAIFALPRSVRHWPVAQKQSSRLISDRHRSVTGRANHFWRANPRSEETRC